MKKILELTNKQDFTHFLIDSREDVLYDNKHFHKLTKGNISKIKADNNLVYIVHHEKHLLIVLNAIYWPFHRDAYWGISNFAGLEPIMADIHTLVRI